MQPDIKSRLLVYRDLLAKWQKSVNLVAPSTMAAAWERHFEDSLQLVSLIPKTATNLSDLGSGAGFPGLVLALACPQLELVHLIESDAKKCAFLLAVSRETGASHVYVHGNRVDSILPSLKTDVVTARALAPLSELLRMTRSQWQRESPALLLFPKGESWREEVAAAEQRFSFTCDAKPSKTAPRAAILCIRDVRDLTPESRAR
jgi:16S rRNA (guanine527-N7)-methyltransferase